MFATNKPIAAICHGPWMLCSCKKKEEGSEKLVPLCSGLKATAFVAIKDDLHCAATLFAFTLGGSARTIHIFAV